MVPGNEIIEAGLADLAAGRESIPALLESIGSPRLRQIGVPVQDRVLPDAEHRLYLILQTKDPDSAHSRYDALIRRLVSFERA